MATLNISFGEIIGRFALLRPIRMILSRAWPWLRGLLTLIPWTVCIIASWLATTSGRFFWSPDDRDLATLALEGTVTPRRRRGWSTSWGKSMPYFTIEESYRYVPRGILTVYLYFLVKHLFAVAAVDSSLSLRSLQIRVAYCSFKTKNIDSKTMNLPATTAFPSLSYQAVSRSSGMILRHIWPRGN